MNRPVPLPPTNVTRRPGPPPPPKTIKKPPIKLQVEQQPPSQQEQQSPPIQTPNQNQNQYQESPSPSSPAFESSNITQIKVQSQDRMETGMKAERFQFGGELGGEEDGKGVQIGGSKLVQQSGESGNLGNEGIVEAEEKMPVIPIKRAPPAPPALKQPKAGLKKPMNIPKPPPPVVSSIPETAEQKWSEPPAETPKQEPTPPPAKVFQAEPLKQPQQKLEQKPIPQPQPQKQPNPKPKPPTLSPAHHSLNISVQQVPQSARIQSSLHQKHQSLNPNLLTPKYSELEKKLNESKRRKEKILESSESDSEMHSETYSERQRDTGRDRARDRERGLLAVQSVKPVRSEFVAVDKEKSVDGSEDNSTKGKNIKVVNPFEDENENQIQNPATVDMSKKNKQEERILTKVQSEQLLPKDIQEVEKEIEKEKEKEDKRVVENGLKDGEVEDQVKGEKEVDLGQIHPINEVEDEYKETTPIKKQAPPPPTLHPKSNKPPIPPPSTHHPSPTLASTLNSTIRKQSSSQPLSEIDHLLHEFSLKKQSYLQNAQQLTQLCSKNREREHEKIQIVNGLLHRLEEQNIKLRAVLIDY